MFSTYERDVIKERIYWALRYTKSAQKTVDSWWTDLYAARACSYCTIKILDQRFLDSRWWGQHSENPAAKYNTQKIQLQTTREPWDCKVDSLCWCIKDVHLLRSSATTSSSSTTTTSTNTTSYSTTATSKNRTWLLLSMSPPRRAALITWHTKFQHQNSWAFLEASIQEEVGETQSA